jgi:carboxyl-terminal processing protease
MNRKNAYLPFVFALVLIAGIFLGKTLPDRRNYDKFKEIFSLIKQNYVDDLNSEEIEEKAIRGLLMDLDPHSAYIPSEMMRDVNDDLRGEFFGIGVQFRIIRDSILVIRDIEGGPAQKAGLRAGDRIVSVDGQAMSGPELSSQMVLDKLKGPYDSKVTVGVYRRGVSGVTPYEITRGAIPSNSVDIAFMVSPGIGFIKINRFTERTYHEFVDALEGLKKKGLNKLILDLRGNSGGLMSSAIAIADEFLPAGKPIVYTDGKSRGRTDFNAERGGMFEGGALVVLIDDLSASASEIIAGALQDNDRATIIGRRSFGKGLVQEQIDLGDSSAIRLTVARYYTPTGRSIQKPYGQGHGEYFADIYERYNGGEVMNPDSIHFADSLKYTTPGGKTVYGGGGIMPDIYVTVDSAKVAPFYSSLSRTDLVYDFVVDYVDMNRDFLSSFGSANNFIRSYRLDDNTFAQFIKSLQNSEVLVPAKIDPESERLLRNLIRSLIARDVYDDEAFYPIYLSTDKTYLKALEVLK